MVDQVLWRRALYLLGEPGVRVKDLGFRYQDDDLYQDHRALADLIVATALNSLPCLPSDRELAH